MPFRTGPTGPAFNLGRPSGGGGPDLSQGSNPEGFVPGAAPPGFQWVQFPPNVPGGQPEWGLVKVPESDTGGISAANAAETARSNRAQEALAMRQLSLDQALGALTSFDNAQRTADTRRVNAFTEARALSGLLVPKGTEFFPGLGPESGLAQVSGNLGLDFEAPSVVEKQFQPQALDQAAPVPAQVQQMLAGLQGT